MSFSICETNSVGNRVLISLETSQLEAGVNEPIERGGVLGDLPYITPTILTDLIIELWELDAEIALDHWLPETGDSIMSLMRNWTTEHDELSRINRCRLWLQVHSIGDLATLDRARIHPHYMAGQRAYGSKLRWPKWQPPHHGGRIGNPP